MTPDLATFRIIYPEFSGVGDPVVQLWLDDAIETLSESAWGQCYAKAVLAHAAHNLSLSLSRQANSADDGNGIVEVAATGVVASAAAGGVSVSFAQPASTSSTEDRAWFSQTPYGQHYLALRKQCLSRGRLGCQ